MAAPVPNNYARREYEVTALQYDGTNAADVIAFVGGAQYAYVDLDGKLWLTPERGMKLLVQPTQFVLKQLRRGGLTVMSEGEFNMMWIVAK
jgi:hypothetical protein